MSVLVHPPTIQVAPHPEGPVEVLFKRSPHLGAIGATAVYLTRRQAQQLLSDLLTTVGLCLQPVVNPDGTTDACDRLTGHHGPCEALGLETSA